MDTVDVPGYLSANTLLALIWASTGVALLFVVARTVIRLRLAGGLGLEDAWVYLAAATLVTTTVLQTIQLPATYYISAVTIGAVPPSLELYVQGNFYVKYEFAIIGLFWTVLWSVKASFLSVYYKLFAQIALYRKLWYVLSVLTFLVYVACWLLSINTCSPPSDYFIFGKCTSPQEGHLTQVNVIYSTSVDIATDLMIMALPIRLIWGVKVSRKQKAGLVVVFGLCAVIIIFAIIRASQVLSGGVRVNLILLGLWSNLESSISVIVGCLPPFKTLLHKMNSQPGYSGYQYNISGSRSKRGPGQPSRSNLRHSSVPLESFNFAKGGTRHQRTESSGDSQEEIIVAPGRPEINVKNDVTIEYTSSPRDKEEGFQAFHV